MNTDNKSGGAYSTTSKVSSAVTNKNYNGTSKNGAVSSTTTYGQGSGYNRQTGKTYNKK